MLAGIIEDFVQQMEAEQETLANILSQTLDFSQLENKLISLVNDFTASVVQKLLNQFFHRPCFLPA